MKKQHLIIGLTFGATLLAGETVAHATEIDTESAKPKQEVSAKSIAQISSTTSKAEETTQVSQPVQEIQKAEETTQVSQPVQETQKAEETTQVSQPVQEAPKAEETTQVSQPVQEAPKAEETIQVSQPVQEASKAEETTQVSQPVQETPKEQNKNQEIQGQIDQEKDHMEQDKTQVGQLEDENKDLQDKVNENEDKKDQEISAVEDTAKEEISDSQKELDKIEQSQIQSEKDKLQNEINKNQDKLNNTKDEISDKEGMLQEKQDELDKLENQNQSNSVMGSLVNNDKIGSHDKIYVGERIPGTDNVKETQEYFDQNEASKNWYLDNKGKEPINNKKLTQDQAWELNLYLMERINAARKAAGQKEFIVTKDMFDKVYQRAEFAKNDFNHNMTDINNVFGKNWAGENLGFAGSYQDYTSLIKSALGTINIMMNADGGEDHWGHRDNFLRDYYKDWGNVEAAFAFVWSDKYNRWVMVFDVMKYDGGTNHAHDLDKKYSGNTNQEQINQLKQEISSLKNKISDLKQQEQTLNNKISDLKQQKENVKFDYNKLDDNDKLDYIIYSQNIEQTKQWQSEKTQEINKKYDEMNKELTNKISSNKDKISQLQTEIKKHQDKISELEGQLEEKPETPSTPEEKPETPSTPEEKPETPSTPEEKPETPSTPEEKPETPSTPEEKPETPSKPEEKPSVPNKDDNTENSMPSMDDEAPATGDPTEEPSESEEDNHIPVIPSEPSMNPSNNEADNSIQDEMIQTPAYQKTTHTMEPSNNRYHFVEVAEAAELSPVQVANPTRMERLHGELPQTGNEDTSSLTAIGSTLVALSSLFGIVTLRRRKEQ